MSNSLEETLSPNEREKVTEIAEKADVCKVVPHGPNLLAGRMVQLHMTWGNPGLGRRQVKHINSVILVLLHGSTNKILTYRPDLLHLCPVLDLSVRLND